MVNSITEQLGRLSVSLPRLSVRLLSTKKKQAKRGWIDPGFAEGHMEKIWVFSHILNGLTVYSSQPVLKANRALKQIPFHGKKLKPAKLRKDYWRPLVMIQFAEGQGGIGRSVYSLLRQMRMLHELSWGDEVFWDDKKHVARSKRQRGVLLNNQKANTIADIAAILSGVGKGNHMWRPAGEVEAEKQAQIEPAQQTEPETDVPEESKAGSSSEQTQPENAESKEVAPVSAAPAETTVASSLPLTQIDPKTGVLSELIPVQLWWGDLDNKNHAREWSANVEHFAFSDAEMETIRAQNHRATNEGVDEPPSAEELEATEDKDQKINIIERQVLEGVQKLPKNIKKE